MWSEQLLNESRKETLRQNERSIVNVHRQTDALRGRSGSGALEFFGTMGMGGKEYGYDRSTLMLLVRSAQAHGSFMLRDNSL